MAVWGAGDPRWLVQERHDGKNVGGWHWQEKNKLEWSKQRLAELLEGLSAELDGSVGSVSVTKVKSVTGEALLTTRKQNKKFAVFDLKLTLAWEGTLVGEEDKVTGEIAITEFTSPIDHEDISYAVTVSGSGAGQQQLRQAVEGLRPAVYAKLDQYAAELQEEE